jgi:H+-translocating NAD(P) transhydrogenase subunit alpha
VITTALIPGRPAPRLVTRAMVESMRPGAVLVDLAVESGGNVEGNEVGKVVEIGGVKIVGHANLPARLAPATSALYARNLLNFVDLLIDKDSGELVINEDDDLVKGALITRDGKVVHPALVRNQAA